MRSSGLFTAGTTKVPLLGLQDVFESFSRCWSHPGPKKFLGSAEISAKLFSHSHVIHGKWCIVVVTSVPTGCYAFWQTCHVRAQANCQADCDTQHSSEYHQDGGESDTEKKFFATDFTHTYVINQSNMTCVSQVPQGTTDVTRIGDRLTKVSLELRGSCTNGATTFTAPQIGQTRVIVFQWKPTTASNPSLTDIMEQANQFDSPFRHDTRQMYKVLYDNCVATTALYNPVVPFKAFIKIPPGWQESQFEAGGVTGTNHLYVLTIAYQSGAAVLAQTEFFCKLVYTDS